MSIGDITGPIGLALSSLLTFLQIKAFYVERARITVDFLLRNTHEQPDELLITNHGKYPVSIIYYQIKARRTGATNYEDVDTGLADDLLKITIDSNQSKRLLFGAPNKISRSSFEKYLIELHIAGKNKPIVKKLNYT